MSIPWSMSSIGNGVQFLAVLIFILIFIGCIGVGIYILSVFNYKIRIWELVETGWRITTKKARRVNRDGIDLLKILGSKRGDYFQPPKDFKCYYKIKKITYLDLIKRTNKDYEFFKWQPTQGEVHFLPYEVLMWNIQYKNQAISEHTKPTFMQQYGGIIGIGLAAVVFIVTIVLLMGYFDKVIEAFQQFTVHMDKWIGSGKVIN